MSRLRQGRVCSRAQGQWECVGCHDPSSRRSALVLCLLLLACCSGCADVSQPVTLSSWQRSVERYVWDEGNGDPNVLRDMSWDDVHKGFAIMSDPEPGRSVDAIGLLLGHRRVGDTGFFVFLVGLVRNQRLQDVQPVALYVDAGRFHWVVGASDRQVIDAYRRADASNAPSGPARAGSAFPNQADSFRLDVRGGEILITHQPSGATWKLTVWPSSATTRSA